MPRQIFCPVFAQPLHMLAAAGCEEAMITHANSVSASFGAAIAKR